MEGRTIRLSNQKDSYRSDEDMFRFLIENSGDILWTIDLSGRWQFMTNNVEKVLHIKVSDIIGKTVWDFVAPDYVEILKEKLKRRMAGEDIPAYEVMVIDGYGRHVPFEVKTSPILDKEGKIVGIQGISRDISQRKSAEKALLKSEEKFKDLVESIHDWVWEADKNVVFTYSSPRVLDYLGYTPEEVNGRSMYDFMEPWEIKRISAVLQNLVKLHKRYDIHEKTLISKQGEPVVFEMTVTLIYDEKGEIWGYQGICRDIRERKRSEEALHRAYAELERRVEDRTRDLARARGTLQAILNTAPIGIIVATAPEGKISFLSPGAERIMGGQMGSTIYDGPKSLFRILRPDGSPFPAEERPLSLSLKQGRHITDVEIQIDRPGLGSRIILVSSAPIRDERDEILAAVATFVDITGLKSTEIELREAKAQAELYLDLMSHDINNMNTMALGYMEMVQQKVVGDREAATLLEKSTDILKSSSQLIDNVRKIQKAETGELQLENINLCDILESVREKHSAVPGKVVIIRTTFPARGCKVTANRLLEDVFANLVGNAIKHSQPDKPVEIDLIVSRVCDHGLEYFRVAVEDNGPGIPDEIKGRLFSRLQRGKTKTAGRGLGLFLSKTLVEDFHGKIWVEDKVKGDYHRGARFVVMLPAARTDTQAASASSAG